MSVQGKSGYLLWNPDWSMFLQKKEVNDEKKSLQERKEQFTAQ